MNEISAKIADALATIVTIINMTIIGHMWMKKHKNFIDLFIRNGLLGLFLNQVMTIFLTVKPIDDIESLQYFPFYFHKIILLPEFFIEGIEEIH